MDTSKRIASRCMPILLIAIVIIFLTLPGCSRSRILASHSPTVLQIANPEALSDAELRQISSCEYWGVCVFEQHEEVEAFGPTYLFKDKNKLIIRKVCRFEECDRMESFHAKPRN